MKKAILVSLALLLAGLVGSSFPFGYDLLEMAKGAVQGHVLYGKFGRNRSVSINTVPESLWSYGGEWKGPTAARLHSFVSSSAADDGDPAGIGGHTVWMEGLGSDGRMQTGEVTLNGVTPVITGETWLRIYRMKLLSAGISLTNVGDITATAAAPDSTVTAGIRAGDGQTHMAIITVPAEKTAYLIAYWVSINKYGAYATASVVLKTRGPIDVATSPWLGKLSLGMGVKGSSFISAPFFAIRRVEEKTDILFQIEEVSTDDVDISGGFAIIMVDN